MTIQSVCDQINLHYDLTTSDQRVNPEHLYYMLLVQTEIHDDISRCTADDERSVRETAVRVKPFIHHFLQQHTGMAANDIAARDVEAVFSRILRCQQLINHPGFDAKQNCLVYGDTRFTETDVAQMKTAVHYYRTNDSAQYRLPYKQPSVIGKVVKHLLPKVSANRYHFFARNDPKSPNTPGPEANNDSMKKKK